MLRSRKLRRWGGLLAVFAFWLQLAVSAGHLHAEDLFGPPGSGHGAAALAAVRLSAGPAPAGAHSDTGADGCAICAVMLLVASAVPPPPFVLPPPPGPNGLPSSLGGQSVPQAASFRLFQPRAPPVA